MGKPVNIIYGVDDSPPFLVTVARGVQLAGLVSIYPDPQAVFREAGFPARTVRDVLRWSMLGLALGANLQAGAPLELPERRPTNDEIMASEEGQRKLAGFMLRRHTDRVLSSHKAGRSTVLFHFDH